MFGVQRAQARMQKNMKSIGRYRRSVAITGLIAVMMMPGIGLAGRLASAWVDQKPLVDGLNGDWASLPRMEIRSCCMAVSAANDSNHFYLMIQRPANLHVPGARRMVLWIDPAGKREKRFGFTYRMVDHGLGGMDDSSGSAPASSSEMRGAVMEPLQQAEDQIVFYDYPGADPEVITMPEGPGLHAAMKVQGEDLVFEFSIPLQDSARQCELNVLPGDVFSLGIETIVVPRPPKPAGDFPGFARSNARTEGEQEFTPSRDVKPGIRPPGKGREMDVQPKIEWIQVHLSDVRKIR
jgi:hypothetical protein